MMSKKKLQKYLKKTSTKLISNRIEKGHKEYCNVLKYGKLTQHCYLH